MQSDKIEPIRETFSPLIGRRIERYQIAEICDEDGTWEEWPDLPIRIYFEDGSVVSISWCNFDDLWMSRNTSLPFDVGDAVIRWLDNFHPNLMEAVGRTVLGVKLGRGQLTIENQAVEIWTRLVIDLGDRWLEVFNKLDENGYKLHVSKPDGKFITCV